VSNAAGPVALAALAATPLDEAGIHLSPRSAISADLFGHASVAYIDDEKTGHVQRVSDSFAEIRGSTLLVFGTDSREVLDVAVNGSNFIATRGRESETFHAVGIHSLNISGFGGDDKIANGTTLNSSLSGGEGRDSIVGGEGNDSISGNAGNDTIRGDTGADRLAGNGGRDRLFGNGGNDQLYGGASADWLYGQNGSDQLFGEGGDDRFFDDYDKGIDTLRGKAGNDSFVTTDGVVDHIFGDGGSDIATADNVDILTSIEVRE
jgi:Ca2+-binding RTX toxin-like protein